MVYPRKSCIEAGLDSVEALIEPLTNSRSGGSAHGFNYPIPKSDSAQPVAHDAALRLDCGSAYLHLRALGGVRLILWRAVKVAILGILLGLLAGLFVGHARAHDHSNPAQNEWYQGLMQPDNPTMSCCGEADAYWADDVHFRNGKTYVTITDDRPDEPLKRPHIPNGTEVEVPNNKLKYDRGNPTGHGILFLSPHPYNFVYCYVQSGGA